jgi:hypothetical protein
MWSLLGGDVTLTIAEPSLDLSLGDDGVTPRLVQHFKAACLLSVLLPGPPSTQAQAQGQAAEVNPDAAATQAEAGAASVPLSAEAPASVEPETHSGDAGDLRLAPAPPGGRRLSALRRALTQADAAAGFSLEVRGPRLSAVVSEGRLLVPGAVREALGRHVHASVALGAREVRALAEEMGDDDGAWVGADAPAADKAAGGSGGDGARRRDQEEGRPRRSGRAGGGGGSVKEDQEEEGAVAAALPLVVQVDSERLRLDARGWLEGRRCVLQRPVQARAELTPELARWGLHGVRRGPLAESLARPGGGL